MLYILAVKARIKNIHNFSDVIYGELQNSNGNYWNVIISCEFCTLVNELQFFFSFCAEGSICRVLLSIFLLPITVLFS